jgi:hypothetical protein
MEIGALAAHVEQEKEKRRAALRRATRALGREDHYRRVFCDDKGQLSESGLAVLVDLAREANFGASDLRASDADLRTNNAMRHMVLHIFSRLALGSQDLLNTQRRMKDMSND